MTTPISNPADPVFLKDAQTRWSTHTRHNVDADAKESVAGGLLWAVVDNVPHAVTTDKAVQFHFTRGEEGFVRHIPGFSSPKAAGEFGALEMDPKPVAVVFRKDKGEVFALIPEVPATMNMSEVTCFTRHGHTAADPRLCVDKSEPATPSEYAPLAAQMQKVGYNVVPRMRITQEMDEVRCAALRETEKQAGFALVGAPAGGEIPFATSNGLDRFGG